MSNDSLPTSATPSVAAPAPLVADPRRASEVLAKVGAAPNGDAVTVGEIVAAFGERGFGVVLMLLGLLNTVPGPPGLSSVVGLPLLLVAMQMVLGRPVPWLPRALLSRDFKRADLLRLVGAARPWLVRVERLFRPRAKFVFRIVQQRVVGVFIALLAICVMIPLPFTNFPPSLAAIIIAMALIEADGVLLAVGFLAGLVAIAITVLVTSAVVGMAILGLRALFGV